MSATVQIDDQTRLTTDAAHNNPFRTGKPIGELVEEIERQQAAKRDYVVPCGSMFARAGDPGRLELGWEQNGAGAARFGVTDSGHRQLATFTRIPKPYYDRCLAEAPEVLAHQLSHWLPASGKRRLVRTLDGDVRALLSERFEVFDHAVLLKSVLPLVAPLGLRVAYSNVTERAIHLKLVSPRFTGEARVGDPVAYGLEFRNSEIGEGSWDVSEFVMQLRCINLWVAESVFRRVHVGRGSSGIETDGGAVAYFSDETKRKDTAAFQAKVGDVCRGILSAERFERQLARLRAGTERTCAPTADPVAVIEVTAKRFGLTEDETTHARRRLFDTGDLSAYGIGDALTWAAGEVEDADRQRELQRTGFQVLDLPRDQWREIETAGARA